MRLERSFAYSASKLDAATRIALNLAALNDSDDLAEIVAGTALAAGPRDTSSVRCGGVCRAG